MVGDERDCDVGVDVDRLVGRVGCVDAVDDRLVEHAGPPEPRPGPLVPRRVEHRRLERVVRARVGDPLRGLRQP
jgi:hypothetical protein